MPRLQYGYSIYRHDPSPVTGSAREPPAPDIPPRPPPLKGVGGGASCGGGGDYQDSAHAPRDEDRLKDATPS